MCLHKHCFDWLVRNSPWQLWQRAQYEFSTVSTHTHTHTHTHTTWNVRSSQDSRPTNHCEVLTAVWQWCALTLHRRATGQSVQTSVLSHKRQLLKLNKHTATSWRHRGKNWAMLNKQWEGSLNVAPGGQPMDSILTSEKGFQGGFMLGLVPGNLVR